MKQSKIDFLQFPDDKFQIVVDKGGLDALMGEESEGSTTSGKQLLNGVSRVTSPGGVYLCISLAQSHVLSKSFESSMSDRADPLPEWTP